MPDGQLIASLLKCATGRPPRIHATPLDLPLPPIESPYFGVARQAAKALADFDMDRALTPRDFARRLDARRRECRRDNGQYSIDLKHKIINSAKFVS
jgi:hypothetical protein